MKDRMFSASVYSFEAAKVREAVARADALSDGDLLNPDLPTKLDRLASHFTFTVATLRPSERLGKRREVKRTIRDYGQSTSISKTVIDVVIPFDGEQGSFSVSPSQGNMISYDVVVNPGTLVITLPDDAELDSKVDEIVRQISENLDRLRIDMQPIHGRVRSAISDAANRRLETVKARISRDQGRSFPIS